MTVAANVSYGVYGKIPANADFIHRDLPRAFVTPWDQWLREALTASRDTLGDVWMQTYLKSPPWRFAVDAGLAGPSTWIGLLLSSIDHVQRCYPLTLAIPLPDSMPLVQLRSDLDPALDRLEALALSLIDGGRSIEDAVQAIAPIAREIDNRARTPPPLLRWQDRPLTLCLDQPRAPTIGAMIANASRGAAGAGFSCWWHRGWGERPAAHIVAQGLPPAASFAAFLDAAWASHGWVAHA